MIEEQATVVSVNENDVLVAASRSSACGQCAAKEDCGQSAIAQWAAAKMVDVTVNNPLQLPLVVGDVVLVGINERSFIKASLLLYFIPLLVMFVFGVIATNLGATEVIVIWLSFTALLSSFYVIKLYSKKMVNKSAYQLVVIKVIK